MEQNELEMLHSLLVQINNVSDSAALDNVICQYRGKLVGGNREIWEALLGDIKRIGETIITLKDVKKSDTRAQLIESLSEKEQAELLETDKVINENRFGYHFQPIVSAVDGEIYSYEALMRPQSQLCPSPYFIIKYAELTDRLIDIERLTFLNVLDFVEHHISNLNTKRIFINSIPEARLSKDDIRSLKEYLIKYSDNIVVEMTEQSELSDAALDEIKAMYRSMGIKIAVDDYGTGYSNVQNLLRYMPDYVKIDRSLLSEIQNNSKKRHFVREIIEFCHANGIMALAEGVETSEELRTVIHLGADLIQGYYTARPAPELIESIPYELRREIKLYRQERDDGKMLHIYDAGSSERVQLDRLVKENYKCILVGKHGDGEVTITSTPGVDSKIHIDVAKGFKGNIVLENVTLSNVKSRPCIDIGEGCDVRVILIGSNQLIGGGVRVPESSRFICSGDGLLSVSIDGAGFYGIGNDADSRHGEIVFEQGVSIDNRAVAGVCIGSGKGGPIRILKGQFILNMTGNFGVGIGSFDADTELDLFACDVRIDMSMPKGVAIGSMNGNCKAYVHSASTACHLSGVDIVGIGSINGTVCDVSICEANATFNTVADHCSAIGTLSGDTSFKLSRAGLHISATGARAFAFGSLEGHTSVKLTDADTSIRLTTETDYATYSDKNHIEISGGRIRFVYNDEEVISG